MRRALFPATVVAVLILSVLATAAFAGTPEQAVIGDPDAQGWLRTDVSISVRLPLGGDSNADATAAYRIAPEGQEHAGDWIPLSVSGGYATATAEGLDPDMPYDVQLRVTDPDGIDSAPAGWETAGDTATGMAASATSYDMLYVTEASATAGIVGHTNQLRMSWPFEGDENTSTVPTYRIRLAKDTAWGPYLGMTRTVSAETTPPGSLEATATRLVPGVAYVAEMSVSDADGINADPSLVTTTTRGFAFVVPTEPSFAGTPGLSPRTDLVKAWLPYEGDSDNDASATMYLSLAGGSSWTEHAMTKRSGSKRFEVTVTGLDPSTDYVAAFEIADGDGTSGLESGTTFPFSTLVPWNIEPLAEYSVDGIPGMAPMAAEHYWWRSGPDIGSPLLLTMLPNNYSALTTVTVEWRLQLGSFTPAGGIPRAVTPEDAGIDVIAGGLGAPDGDGWYGPFTKEQRLRLELFSYGRYAYTLDMHLDGEYTDGTPFSAEATRSCGLTTVSPNLSRREETP